MPLTAVQQSAWFQAEIGLSAEAHNAIVAIEAIQGPDDLVELEEEAVSRIAKNLKNPTDRIPNPRAGQPGEEATIPRPPSVIGAVAQQ